MLVYIGGEDFVTKHIAKRLVKYCLPNVELEFEDLTFRDHGTRALERINLMLNLAKKCPVVGIFDSDNECIIELLEKYMHVNKNVDFAAINFAVDEAEAWLMADRIGLADYIDISVDMIPVCKPFNPEISSSIPYKTSLYILQEIAPYSNNPFIKSSLTCERPGKKPPTYNSVWGDFIDNIWNIDKACINSESLLKSIKRIRRMFEGKD